MSNTNSKEREMLKALHPSKRWRLKVETWTDSQVLVIFWRYRNLGKI